MGRTSDKRIAVYLPNLDGGGAERAYLELAGSLAALGTPVDLVISHRVGPYVDEIPGNVRLVDLYATGKFNSIYRLARYLRYEAPAALLSGGDVSNAVAVVAIMFAGRTTRCVISQRGMIRAVWQVQRPRTWRFWMIILKALYRRADLIICNSEAARRELVKDFGFQHSRCPVIYNAIDTDRIRYLAEVVPDDPWFKPESPPVVISVGSLSPGKDMATLVRAFSIIRQTHSCFLLLLGEGPERSRLEALIRKYKLEQYVRMPGFIVNPFPMIQRARVLVSASLAEGCPNVIQQALACGTPIVATDCPGGTSEILEGGRWGRLVPVKDPEAMASAIIKTLNGELLPNGKGRVAQFDRKHNASLYRELLIPDSVVGNQGGRFFPS